MPLPANSVYHCADCTALARLARRGLVRFVKCDACDGTGTIRARRHDAPPGTGWLGAAQVERHCGVCHGTGAVTDPPAHVALRDARVAGLAVRS